MRRAFSVEKGINFSAQQDIEISNRQIGTIKKECGTMPALFEAVIIEIAPLLAD